MKITLPILSLLLILSPGCSPTDPRIAQQTQRFEQLEKSLAEQRAHLDTQSNFFYAVSTDLLARQNKSASRIYSLEALRDRANTFSIHPDTVAFEFCAFRGTTFYISTKDITPYLDGYKVKLEIGNPHQATFQSLTIRADWGFSTNSEPWGVYLHSTTNKITETLSPGSWTLVELTLLPCTSEDLRIADFALEMEVVSLGRKPKP
jgi:uncharacterized coiled-coil protein SlyX